MLKTDEDALICDLAETYQIFDIRAVPVKTLARLSCGLRADSRIKLKLADRLIDINTQLQIMILDELRWLHWAKSADGVKNRNVPKSLLSELLNRKDEDKPTVFDSPEEFEECRQRILKEAQNG